MAGRKRSEVEGKIDKLCTGCNQTLPLDAFYQKSPSSQDGAHRSAYGRAMAPCKECRIARSRADKESPERRRQIRAWNLKKMYGITLEEYDEMLTQQNGVCAICSQPPSGTTSRVQYLHVDHCHTSGVIRALLCHNCNKGLGCFKDDPALLRKGAAYLEG